MNKNSYEVNEHVEKQLKMAFFVMGIFVFVMLLAIALAGKL